MLDNRTRPIPKPGYAHVTQRNSASRIEVDKLSLHCDTKRALRGMQITGSIRVDGTDIYAPEIDPPLLRRRFGWVA